VRGHLIRGGENCRSREREMWACDIEREKEVRHVDSQHPVQMKRQTVGYGMGWLSGPGFLSLLVAFFYFLNSKMYHIVS
jgi:hypothetical protein